MHSEEWQGIRHVVGSDAMPASTKTRAHDAQCDNSLRGVSPHADGLPAADASTANDMIIRGRGRARQAERSAWLVTDAATSFLIPGHFRAF